MLDKWVSKINEVVLKYREIEASLEELKKQKQSLDAAASQYGEFYNVVRGVLHSWKEKDPGKSDDAYFLLEAKEDNFYKEFFNRTGYRRVVVKELLYEEDVAICKRPTIPLSEALKADCPSCGEKDQFVVEHYVQEEDSPDGDSWLKEKLIPCFNCFNVSLLGEKEYSNMRF